ncbi:2OG-Fe(II) oxygenase [Okeania sp.]|uniref:2OG-Fe(II) oxygenase n=1 Tax=Okeania sp. TaxID=3100323 RepID=UPI002B4ABDB1|nr:2OG-Fe(II) oxygenase [Okeania sp.]MEB3342013.1 2OG-Fe(II) oxygenase [Okeania sp.]
MSVDKLQELTTKSIDLLETILDNSNTPLLEKAEVALRILEIAQSTQANIQNSITSASNKIIIPATPKIPKFIPNFPQSISNHNQSQILPINCLQIYNFLEFLELEVALKVAIKNQDNFTDSSVHNKSTNQVNKFRQSLVLHHKFYSELAKSIQKKVLKILPSVLERLNHPNFSVSNIVIQLTAHNDGCFYTIHSDANTEMTATRKMTYVYYFYQQPKSFSGGELVIYETKVQGNNLFKHNDFKVIEPHNNSIIFFPSRYLHEVLPVSCPTKEFEHSRFTFNGWIRE